jgi:hypothetical protein
MAQADLVADNPAHIAGTHVSIGNHTFRATGITAWLSNGETLAQARSDRRARRSPVTARGMI